MPILLRGIVCLLFAGQAAAAPSAAPSPAPSASPSAPVPAAERALRKRVAAWWAARERKDHQAMYDLFEPAYRKRVSFPEFMPESVVRSRMEMKDVAVTGVTPEAGGRTRVSLRYRGMLVRSGLPIETSTEDVWILLKGKWFKVHQPTSLPFPSPSTLPSAAPSAPSPAPSASAPSSPPTLP